jgi:hypothetical protein
MQPEGPWLTIKQVKKNTINKRPNVDAILKHQYTIKYNK